MKRDSFLKRSEVIYYMFTEYTGDRGDTLRLPLWQKHFRRHRSVSKEELPVVTVVSSFSVGYRYLEQYGPLALVGGFSCLEAGVLVYYIVVGSKGYPEKEKMSCEINEIRRCNKLCPYTTCRRRICWKLYAGRTGGTKNPDRLGCYSQKNDLCPELKRIVLSGY